MTVWQQEADHHVWIVGVQGRLAQEQTSDLENTLLALLAEKNNRLVVDLSQTSYINSGGLRTLVTAWRQARYQDGDLILFGLNQHLRDIFDMVGFDKVFQIVPSQQDALAAWEKKL